MILAGDIGGTKTVLALLQATSDGLQQVRNAIYASQDYDAFEEIIRHFLQLEPHVDISTCCFGVAGPVLDGKCTTTNLPWSLDESALAQIIGSPHVRLMNDLEAAAYGMLQLTDDDVAILNPGANPGLQANMAVIAAGTGLGEAILSWDGEGYRAIATEGGHSSFAPQTDIEIE